MYRPSFRPQISDPAEAPQHPEQDSFKVYGEGKLFTTSGNYYRYFIESIVDKSIVEVTKQEYDDASKSKVYKTYRIDWQSSDPIEDYVYGEFVRAGSNSKNLKEVGKNLPVFEFLAKKDELIVEYLEALPKQFVTKSGDFYSGLYHIHFEGGALAGPEHTSDPHKILYSPGTRLSEYLPEYFTAPAVMYSKTRKSTYNREE